MAKINQIQNKLREMSGEAFQKLADTYLYKKGYERINPLGSVIGADKVRKGTPDTLISLPNGKYIFAEYTTIKQEEVYEKLKSDLSKCFDETKTGLPVEKLEEIIFCHTSQLEVAEENSLAEECKKRGVNLNIFGIGPISYDLYQKYPGIARDFLSIEVDTGQVISSDEFVTAYNKNALATPLDITFHFREEEVERVLQCLEIDDLIIVSGCAGVGKSRLALECCTQFKEAHPEYDVHCIFHRGPDLFEDLRVHFSESGYHLILVDDANRINRFEYVIQLLQDQREAQKIKVIATVRDYALDKVREIAKSYRGGTEIELRSLEEKQIKQLVKDEYNIQHHLYLERIAEIAQGNPRLAIMAAEVARRENTLQSIGDVSTLYEKYFATIQHDLKDLGEQNLLKAAGIVTFFRAVDRSDQMLMRDIEAAFSMSSAEFWEAVCRLHELEILDMYEEEVVRTSDQVLATYLFYVAFFKERILDFSVLLKHFFPRFRHRLVDTVSPLATTFNRELLVKVMQPSVDRAWYALEEARDEEGLLHLIDVFWFLKETDTLLYIRNRILVLAPEAVDPSDIDLKPASDFHSDQILNILGIFCYSNDDNCAIALNLLADYLVKRPRKLPQILYLLNERFGFKHISYLRGFSVQRTVIEVLWERACNGQDWLFSILFLAVAEEYLHIRFHTTEPKRAYTIQMIDFDIPSTPDLLQLRQLIWNRCLFLFRSQALRKNVLHLLQEYSRFSRQAKNKVVLENDATQLLSFIESGLDPINFQHCLLVQEYLDMLEDRKMMFNEKLRERFQNETYLLSKLLFPDWAKMRILGLKYEEVNNAKIEMIEKHFIGYDLTNYKYFFDQCLEIHAGLDQHNKNFQLQSGIVDVLGVLAKHDPDLYARVLNHYLELGDPFNLNSFLSVKRLVEVCGANRAYDILNNSNCPTKRRWLFAYYSCIPAEEIKVESLEQLYQLYWQAGLEELPHSFAFLLSYQVFDEKVLIKVTRIILAKTKTEPKYAYTLSTLFDFSTETDKLVTRILANDLNLSKRIYFAVRKTDPHHDYEGQIFAWILDLDPGFLLEYIDQICDHNNWTIWYDDQRDYSFLWRRDDYKELMTQMVERVYKWGQIKLIWRDHLEAFFIQRSERWSKTVEERQDLLLKGLIEHQYNDINFINFIFRLISNFPSERRHPFISLFLRYNNKFQDFEWLPLEPDSWEWSGSKVPTLQRRVEYFESLLPTLNTVDLLPYKHYIERRIARIRESIEYEKKSDFMED